MVSVFPFKGIRSIDAAMFTTPPYDVIPDEDLPAYRALKISAIRIILPEGSDSEKYTNAKKALDAYLADGSLFRDSEDSIYYFRQESLSSNFAQEGYVFTAALKDYEDKKIKIHEFTGQKHLEERIKIIDSVKINTGLIWTVYKQDDSIESLVKEIKKKQPLYNFEKFGYRQIFWKESDPTIIKKVQDAFANKTLYIADGHHRMLSAATYRKKMIDKYGDVDAPWQRVMIYSASDKQVRLLAYNRVIRKMNIDLDTFIKKVEENFTVKQIESKEGYTPVKKHDIALYLKGKGWYQLVPKKTEYPTPYDRLDTVIVQNLIFDHILGVKNPRETDILEFVGGAQAPSPKDQEAYVNKKGYIGFMALYPVDINDLESIADNDGVMPPKSTWFDPKLLTGLVFYNLEN
jgi:uncharacterized protein (DUF1015 family)